MIAVLAALLLLPAGILLGRHRYTLITVDGASMQPALAPGDRVLVRRVRADGLRPGQVVVVRRPWPDQRWSDPQPGPAADARWLIKRVAVRDTAAGTVWLLGDNPDRSYDSRQWGACPVGKVRGVVVTVFRGGSQNRRAPAVPSR